MRPMKRAFIALKMAGVAGQEKLSGICRFLGENRIPYRVDEVERYLQENAEASPVIY